MKTLDNFNKIRIQTLAGYILKNYGPMSHLKLQKLLYYCQAYHLAYFGDSLFDSEFQAWVHGPVCREIYDVLKGKSVLYSDIKYNEEDFDPEIKLKENISSDQIDLIDEILESLGKWSGSELENATHSEYPWIKARGTLAPNQNCSEIILKQDMLDFYKSEVSGWKI